MKKKEKKIKFCHVIIKFKIITKWQTKILKIFSEKKKRDKSKCKNTLGLRLRLKLTNIEPDFEKQYSSIQSQPSHQKNIFLHFIFIKTHYLFFEFIISKTD